jgi:antirestriction protein ArdC
MKLDVYSQVTDRVLEMMEQHGSNWVNPFARKGKSALPVNIASKKHYRGVNTLLLSWSGFVSPVWGTYKQWNERDCQVRKGEKSTTIVFWQFIEKEEAGKVQRIPFLKYYNVFNADQVDGYQAEVIEEPTVAERIAGAEDFFRKIPAQITFSDAGRAYYSPARDSVHVPALDVFEDTPTSTAAECYYSTISHELVHWTGHKSRLNREQANAFGSEDYAREELIAELGAAFLCANLGISSEPRIDHAHYLNGWIKKLGDHKREFVSAASAATKAVDLLIGMSEPEQVAQAA